MENISYDYTQNRELSWLKFNERVLDEARDNDVPLMERLKFVSIFANNLDEFFMIRVGSLYELSRIKNSVTDNKSGMTTAQQLNEIYKAVKTLYHKKDETYEEIVKALNAYEIFSLDIKKANEMELKYLKTYFKEQILPLLSPQIIDNLHPFPHIKNKVVHIGAYLENGNRQLLGIIPIPEALPEIVYIPGSYICYVNVEQIVLEFAEMVFENHKIIQKTCLCVTRNADINLNEDFDENVDFRHAMKKLLSKRKRLSVVRLEIESEMNEFMMGLFMEKFNIKKEQIFITKSPMKMSYVNSLENRLTITHRKMFCYPEFIPQVNLTDQLHGSVLRHVKKTDILLFYPYESMELFLSLIKEAAYDRSVVSIKITIYRLARKAKLVEYLCAAAENGKEVSVLIELRARFDELNNIDWSERLEEAGIQILYGFDEFKVHSKICLITYKEKGTVRYVTQVGTGNYNEKTAKLYTDLSLITGNQSIGEDAVAFFKNMAIGNLNGVYKNFLIAPNSMKSELLKLIEKETDKGEDGRIIIKVNSVTDRDIIDALAKASQAGVKIFLIVRGICCILPEAKGYTDNIVVISIVGRFLEHSRIFSFGSGDSQKLYISSADIMTRNMERRVEAACPILDENIKDRINKMIDVLLSDNVKARTLNSYGDYEMRSRRTLPVNSQEYFINESLAYSKPIKSEEKKTKWFSVILDKFKGLF